MRQQRIGLLLGLATSLGLTLASLGFAQTERPWLRLFGPKTPPAKVAEDPKRQAEIAVELAWLADPVTFPYYLEAKSEGSSLQIRGFVPNQAVREHALRLARVQSTLTVTDAMKEHPSLLVRPTLMAPQQLQNTVTSSLREALPKQAASLQVQCGADGKVTVRGPVKTAEEKIAVSHALRRLHGCTSVQNLTQIPGEPETSRTVAATPTSETKQTPRPWLGLPFIKKDAKTPEKEPVKAEKPPTANPVVAKQERVSEAPAKAPALVSAPMPPRIVEGPRLLPPENRIPVPAQPKAPPPAPPEEKSLADTLPVVTLPKEPAPTIPLATAPKEPAPPSPMLALPKELSPPPKEPAPPSAKPAAGAALTAQLQKLILEKCSGARDVRVEFKTPTELRVELTVRMDEQITTFAGVILSLPELADYRERLDLQFKIEP